MKESLKFAVSRKFFGLDLLKIDANSGWLNFTDIDNDMRTIYILLATQTNKL